MGALRWPIILGGVAIVLLVMAGRGAAPTEASEQTATIYWNMPSQVQGNDETPQYVNTVPRPCSDCYITSVTPELEGFNTATSTWGVSSYVSTPPARLHHMVLFNQAQVDATCAHDPLFSALGDRWFAAGDERATLAFPAGYGYYIPPAGGSNNWAAQIMVHNFSSQPQNYRLRMDFKYHPATDNLKPMKHLWLDVNNCNASTYETPQGYFDYHWDWTSGSVPSQTADDVEGKIMMMGGHVHDLGVSVSATRGSGGSAPTICASQGGYAAGSTWNPPTIASPEAPAAAHPNDNVDVPGDPAYQGHIESMVGCAPNLTIQVGDTIRLHSQYNATATVCDGTPGDNPNVPPNGPGVSGCIDDVMGIMGTWIYDNCPTVTNPGQDDMDVDDYGDLCDPDTDGDASMNVADADDDNDGYDDIAESGSSLCGNGLNDDTSVFPVYPGPQVADDAVADDGCPGGPSQVGAFSEAQFKTGTGSLARCGAGAVINPSPSWPSDIQSGSVPNSTDKINILDITGLLAPARRLDTSPGHTNFDSRYDLVPGRGLFVHWVNVNDLTALLAGPSGYPPMFSGARAFNGPACTGA
jgi:hypothetical protein